MNDKLIKKVISEFSESADNAYEKSFSIKGVEGEVFTIRIERKKDTLINESISMEALSNSISALPSGAPCDCCGGSGRSR
ncbi:hypothetical protein [Halomonas sp. 141]|uniref:hypothetical protein n=1 Tax=Halomonas sp. 141 TaxID=2056666 RepID=UPI0012FD8651|nr:hypothetical protein [Halomonas sp. 141]